jgi:multicomponent Na+:H+ antiporter subunit G
MSDIIGIILLSIGFIFNFIGCIGLIRLPDVYNRLQASTKCVTLGTCSIFLSLVFFFGISEIGIKAIIAISLLGLSATVAAHALSRGAYIFGVGLGDKSVIDDYKDQVEKDDNKKT